MHKFFITICISMVVVGGWLFLSQDSESQGTTPQEVQKIQENVTPKSQFDIETHVVEENETFADVIADFDIGYGQMLEVLDAASSTYDFTRIKVGQPMTVTRNTEGEIVYLEYEKNKNRWVRVHFVDIGYEVEEGDIVYDVEIVTQRATINTSLYIDGLNAGVPENIIMQFADTFAWTIDFAVQVKTGDSFEVVYEKRSRNGQDAGNGMMLAGKFVNVGEEYHAYLFEDATGDLAYFSGEGESMEKQFLRAPLNYRQITSGFTYGRFHPVLKQNYDHLAIDYAAPIGTPIMAVGDGVISFAGWNNQGFGNFIDIRHNEMYQTQYAHLNGLALGIKNGVRVTQGQVIGYVGSTGYSTGPHLHYQIKYYGKLVDPLKIELPPGDPVEEEKQDAFEQRKTELEKYFN